MKELILFSIMALGAVNVLGQAAPDYSKYPARVEKATARQINFRSHPRAKTFRTNLKEGLSGGVNFAGHYIVVTWGCGTSCGHSAIIDGKTGTVFFPKQLEATSRGDGELIEKDPVEYKPNSRLLIVNGYPGGSAESPNGKYGIWYYEWTGKTLKFIKYVKKSETANQ
jgi:hypothetical protein